MEVTITAIKRTPRIAKASGKPFVSVGIKTNVHGDKWLSGFADIHNADWEEGDIAHIEVETKGEYTNFKAIPGGSRGETKEQPSEFATSNAEIKNLLVLKVIPLLEAIYKQNPPIKKETAYDVAEADRFVEDSPF